VVDIKVTNLLTSSVTVDRDSSATNIREFCDWTASSEGPHSGSSTTRILSPDTPYRIEFIEDEQVMLSFLYFQCLTLGNYSNYRFMCPESGLDAENDVFIDYFIGGLYEIYPETLFGNDVGMRDHFGGDFWVLPYDEYYTAFSGGQRVDYFLSLQSPTSLQEGPFILYRDALVPGTVPGRTWEINDAEIRLPSGKKFVVEGILLSNGATFTASGANWGGIEFKNGSEGLLQNVDVLKVGSGAYTGAMTIRNGADVTIEAGDQIILGPTFVAELGSTFTARIVPGLSTAPPGPQPDLMGEPLLAVEEVLGAVSYPNPFNPRTTIRFTLAGDAPVTITVFNILGQEVATLVDEPRAAGVQEVVWDVRETSGMSLPSGVYVYRIQAGDQIETGHMVLAK
jgi:hypothetical protein